jgi:hypothetical protein
MRFPVFLSLLFLLTLKLSAQDRKGSFYLGGGTNFTLQRSSGTAHPDAHILRNPTVVEGFERGNSYRSGYFLGQRVLVGAELDYFGYRYTLSDETTHRANLAVRPFLRYYFTEPGRVTLFAEVGYGVFTTQEPRYPNQTGNYRLSVGVEILLSPGVLATGHLSHHIAAGGMNFTAFQLGINYLTRGFGEATASPPLSRGTWLTNGQIGTIAYGRKNTEWNKKRALTVDLGLRVGYVFLPGLLIEVVADWQRQTFAGYARTGFKWEGPYPYDYRSAGVQLRYYPLRRGRLLPFVSVGGMSGWSAYTSIYGPFDGDLYLRHSTSQLGVGQGVSYFLSDRVSADLSLTYRHELQDQGGDRAKERVGLEAGLGWYLF